jgi:PilZ domain-containing protein
LSIGTKIAGGRSPFEGFDSQVFTQFSQGHLRSCAHRAGCGTHGCAEVCHKESHLMEQRRYDRVSVGYSASFSGRSYRAPGLVLNLCMFGCRARVAFLVGSDEHLSLLIHLPGSEHPLYVSRAEVRWLEGQEVGMEFIHMELEDRRRLAEVIRAIEGNPESRTETPNA